MPSGRVLPSSCIRGTNENPNSFFSPFSFAMGGKIKKEREKGITHLSARSRSPEDKREVKTHEGRETKPAVPALPRRSGRPRSWALPPAAPLGPTFPPLIGKSRSWAKCPHGTCYLH